MKFILYTGKVVPSCLTTVKGYISGCSVQGWMQDGKGKNIFKTVAVAGFVRKIHILPGMKRNSLLFTISLRVMWM